MISVESKCFMPEDREGTLNNMTSACVEEYAWSVFCIYTDVIDYVIQKQNVVSIVTRDSPSHLGVYHLVLVSIHSTSYQHTVLYYYLNYRDLV